MKTTQTKSKKASKSRTTETSKAKEAPLSPGQIKILTALAKAGKLSRKEIAKATGIDPSGFCISIGYAVGTETADKYRTGRDLYTRGLVKGSYATIDGREVWMEAITAAGRKALGSGKA